MESTTSGYPITEAQSVQSTRFQRTLWSCSRTCDLVVIHSIERIFAYLSRHHCPSCANECGTPLDVVFLLVEHADRCSGPPLAPEMYRIASYNVMADVFSPPSQFPHLAPERVGWMYRGPRIAGEIFKVNPTILCLQELGVDEEGAHIRPFLARSGYEGVYKPNAWKEGCAVFWQTHAYAISV